MRRPPFRFRLLLPLLALAGAVVFLSRCGDFSGTSGPAPTQAEAKAEPEPPQGVDAWAGQFARQIPPPTAVRKLAAEILDTTTASEVRLLPNGDAAETQ